MGERGCQHNWNSTVLITRPKNILVTCNSSYSFHLLIGFVKVFSMGKCNVPAGDVTVLRMETMEMFGIKTTQLSLKRNIIIQVKEVDFLVIKVA